MTAAALLDRLVTTGVVVEVDGADLVIDGPDDILTDEVLVELAGRKAEVLTLLASPPGPAWVEWARALPAPEWRSWRARAKQIEARLPNPGSIEAIERSMELAWQEQTGVAAPGAVPAVTPPTYGYTTYGHVVELAGRTPSDEERDPVKLVGGIGWPEWVPAAEVALWDACPEWSEKLRVALGQPSMPLFDNQPEPQPAA